MKKKFLLSVIVILIILGGGIIVLSTVTISSPTVKNLVVKQIGEILGREVIIKDLRINLLRGIEARGIVIGNAQGFTKNSFLKSDSFIFKYRLLPLLKRKLMINKIVLVNPRILIESNKEGIWNLPDLAKSQGTKRESQTGNFLLFLSQMNLKNGEITLRDRRFSSSNSETKIKDINLKLSNFSPLSSTKVKANANFVGSCFELSGEGNIFKKEGKFTLKLKDFDFTRLSHTYRNLLPLKVLKGIINLNLQGELKARQEFVSRGNISLDNFALEKIKNIKSNVEYRINVDFPKQLLNLINLEGEFNHIPFVLQGKIKDFAKNPQYNFKGEIKSFELNEYLRETTSLKDMIYGKLDSKFSFAGQGTSLEELKKNLKGRISLKLKDGRLSSLTFQKKLGKFLDLSNLEDIKYNSISGHFDIGEGVIKTDDLKIDGLDVDFLIQGIMTFEGEINYKITGLFPEEYAHKISGDKEIASLFRNEKGETVLEIEVGGDLKSPRFKLSTAHMQKKVKEKLKEELKKEVERGLKELLEGL